MLYKKSQVEIIRAFSLVCEGKPFKEVAEDMDISPSSISLYIKTLETIFGGELFRRDGHKFLLNSASKDLHPLAQECLRAFDNFWQAIQNIELSRMIRIAAHPLPNNLILTDIVARECTSRNSKYKFELYELHVDDAVKKLTMGELDCIIYPISKEFFKQYEFDYIDLWDYDAVTIVHPNHPSAKVKADEFTLQDLKHRLVASSSGYAVHKPKNFFEKEFQKVNIINYTSIVPVIKKIEGITTFDKHALLLFNDSIMADLNVLHTPQLVQNTKFSIIINKTNHEGIERKIKYLHNLIKDNMNWLNTITL